jgi:hypothetical protein
LRKCEDTQNQQVEDNNDDFFHLEDK